MELRDVVLVVLEGAGGFLADAFFVGPEGGVGVDGALVLAELLRVNQRDELGAEDLVVDALVGREERGVQGVDLEDDGVPVLEVGLLLGGVDEGELGEECGPDDLRRGRRAGLCARRLRRCRSRAGAGLRWKTSLLREPLRARPVARWT